MIDQLYQAKLNCVAEWFLSCGNIQTDDETVSSEFYFHQIWEGEPIVSSILSFSNEDDR